MVDDDDVIDDDDSGDDDDSALPVRPPLPWKDDPCIGITSASAAYADRVATWVEQDALSPVGAGGVVVAGSSSIRRWDGAHRDLSPWGHVVQRGFGGSRLYDVAAWAPELVLAHDPRGVVVFAGTNDIAGGASAADVVTAYRCLAQQVYSLEPSVPLYFIGITPTPSRWANWDRSSAVNEAVAGFAAEHPDLRYIDTPAAFLGTGEPPDAGLFVEDQLHLNVAGYALWTTVILDALEGWDRADVGGDAMAPGTDVRVDLGPDNPEDGTRTDVDAAGAVWNSWHSAKGGEAILAGERLGDLLDTTGATTGIGLVVAGGFRSNGLVNGGLQAPDPARLGGLAVGTATQDYFYVDGADSPGGLALTGLDPAGRYTLRLFGSRDSAETRVTRYRIDGAERATLDLTTSGIDIGADGYDGNTDTVVELTNVAPDAWGRLHIDLSTVAGAYAYVGLIELVVE